MQIKIRILRSFTKLIKVIFEETLKYQKYLDQSVVFKTVLPLNQQPTS